MAPDAVPVEIRFVGLKKATALMWRLQRQAKKDPRLAVAVLREILKIETAQKRRTAAAANKAAR